MCCVFMYVCVSPALRVCLRVIVYECILKDSSPAIFTWRRARSTFPQNFPRDRRTRKGFKLETSNEESSSKFLSKTNNKKSKRRYSIVKRRARRKRRKENVFELTTFLVCKFKILEKFNTIARRLVYR